VTETTQLPRRYRVVWRSYLRPRRPALATYQRCKHVDGSSDVTTAIKKIFFALHSGGGRWASLDLLSCWVIGLQSELGLYARQCTVFRKKPRSLWPMGCCTLYSILHDAIFSLLHVNILPGQSPSVAVDAAVTWCRPWLGQAPPTLPDWMETFLGKFTGLLSAIPVQRHPIAVSPRPPWWRRRKNKLSSHALVIQKAIQMLCRTHCNCITWKNSGKSWHKQVKTF